MKNRRFYSVVLLGSLLLVGCSLTKKDSLSSEPEQLQPSDVNRIASSPVGNKSVFVGKDSKDYSANGKMYVNKPGYNQTYYFDFDSSRIHEEDLSNIASQVGYLANHPNAKIRLEGNTDSRGSREYNVALGERRAKSVEELMEMKGIPREQIDIVSYGQERPIALGHSEAAYKLNRRVDLIYKDRG